MADSLFNEPAAMQVWDARCRLSKRGHARECDNQATWERVATALS